MLSEWKRYAQFVAAPVIGVLFICCALSTLETSDWIMRFGAVISFFAALAAIRELFADRDINNVELILDRFTSSMKSTVGESSTDDFDVHDILKLIKDAKDRRVLGILTASAVGSVIAALHQDVYSGFRALIYR